MKILFVHFPVEMTEVEGIELPLYFQSKENDVFTIFLKDTRKQRFAVVNGHMLSVTDELLMSLDFDLIICKSSSFQTYGKRYAKKLTKVVNITPMGIKENEKDIDFCFDVDQLIKSPDRSMQEVFQKQTPWKEKLDQILISGSIGGDKNQLEFINFFNPKKFPQWKILFAGPIKNIGYVEQLKTIMMKKDIAFEFLGPLHRKDLANIMSKSKWSALTTDPRPSQSFDPGPRVIFESISGGTPCILSDLVVVHKLAYPFCVFYEHGNFESFNQSIDKALKIDLEKMSNECYEVGSTHFTLENGCKSAYEIIMSQCVLR